MVNHFLTHPITAWWEIVLVFVFVGVGTPLVLYWEFLLGERIYSLFERWRKRHHD